MEEREKELGALIKILDSCISGKIDLMIHPANLKFSFLLPSKYCLFVRLKSFSIVGDMSIQSNLIGI